jgi:glycosyltransferase involved in cell wall biosynthesis
VKKVSVIIPLYRVEAYIAAAIESVLAQTYPHFELIIVNNASPDRSIQICQQYRDPRITLLHQANRGPAGSRNTGIRHATGDYIAFLDGDDLWMPDKLAHHVAHLERCPQVGISFCYSEFIDEAGQSLGLYMMPNRLEGISPTYVLSRCPMGNGSVSVYRRQVFEAIRFSANLRGTVEDCYFDESLPSLEDGECWFRMAVRSGYEIAGVAEVLTRYRLRSDGSSAHIERHLSQIEPVIEKMRLVAPELMVEQAACFRAYQYRFLARRLVMLDQGRLAVGLMWRAIAAYWPIVLENPARTLVTLAAAYGVWWIPRSLTLRSRALRGLGWWQTLRKRVSRGKVISD